MLTTCTVEGMTCGNCALSITRLLQSKGASTVTANAATGEVSFTPPEGTEPTKLYDAIDSLGYHVVRDEEASDAHAGHHHAKGASWVFPLCLILTLPLLAHMWLNWPLLHQPIFQAVLATIVFGLGCWQFGKSAVRSLLHGLPNMNVLILLGAAAAYVYSLAGWLGTMQGGAHHYLFFETAASIITLVMGGNWLESRVVKTTSAAIDALARLQPAQARLVMTDSLGKDTVMEVEQRQVRSGDVVLVHTGEAVPVDGEILRGNAELDESMITGESSPAFKREGDAVVGGTIVASGSLRVRATAVGNASVLAGILRAVREAQSGKRRCNSLRIRLVLSLCLRCSALPFLRFSLTITPSALTRLRL